MGPTHRPPVVASHESLWPLRQLPSCVPATCRSRKRHQRCTYRPDPLSPHKRCTRNAQSPVKEQEASCCPDPAPESSPPLKAHRGTHTSSGTGSFVWCLPLLVLPSPAVALAPPVDPDFLWGSLCPGIPLLSPRCSAPLPVVHCSLAPHADPT